MRWTVQLLSQGRRTSRCFYLGMKARLSPARNRESDVGERVLCCFLVVIPNGTVCWRIEAGEVLILELES